MLGALAFVFVATSAIDLANAQPTDSVTTPSTNIQIELRPLGLTLTQAPAGASGVAISEVHPDSDAAKKDLKPGDVIDNAGGDQVSTPEGVEAAMRQAIDLGRTAMMLYIRSGDQRRVVAIQISPPVAITSTQPGAGDTPGRTAETDPKATDTKPGKEEEIDIVEALDAIARNVGGRASERDAAPPGRLAALIIGGRTWLGIRMRDPTDEEISGNNLTDRSGTVVSFVSPNGAASQADLQEQDFIRGLTARPVRQGGIVVDVSGNISNGKDLSERIATLEPGSEVTLHVLRNGIPSDLRARLGPIPSSTEMGLWLERAEKLFDEGKYSEAAPLYNNALSVAEELYGADEQILDRLVNKLAASYYLQGLFKEAEPLAVRALAFAERQKGADHPDLMLEVANLAMLYGRLERYGQAEPLYRRLIALREKVLGLDHPKLTPDLERLADIYAKQKRDSEAEPLLKRSLAIYEKAFGPDHLTRAVIFERLGIFYRSQGRTADAVAQFMDALSIRVKALAPGENTAPSAEPNISGVLGELEILKGLDRESLPALYNEYSQLSRVGKYVEAERAAKRVVAHYESLLGSEHPIVAWHSEWLGACYAFTLGQPDKGFQLLKRALTIAVKAYGPDHPAVGKATSRLAYRLFAYDRTAEAEPYYQRALAIADKVERRYNSINDAVETEKRNDGKVAFSDRAEPPPQQNNSADILYWQSIKDTSSIAKLESYLVKFPDGTFADLARLGIARLGGKAHPSSSKLSQTAALSDRDAAERGGAIPSIKTVTVMLDATTGKKMEISCRTVHDKNYKGAVTQICSEGRTPQFDVRLAEGTEATCDGRENFAVYSGGRLLACRLKHPVIVVTERGVERCSHDIELTNTGKLARCDLDRN